MMKKLMLVAIILLIALPSAFAGDGKVASKFDLKFYGYLKLETIYDQKVIAGGDRNFYVYDEASYLANEGEKDNPVYSMNARASRIGVKIGGPELSNGVKVSGLLEIDFEGGFAASSIASTQPQPRLRHAAVMLTGSHWQGVFGQYNALFNGPFPTNTVFDVGAAKGNLWMRFNQIQVSYKTEMFKVAGSINRPRSGGNTHAYFAGDSDPIHDGELSGLPLVMGRGWLYANDNMTFSVMGHWGQSSVLDQTGTSHDVTSFSVGGDAMFKFGKAKIILRGFMGDDLKRFLGGIFQGVNVGASEVGAVSAVGGWAQGSYQLSKQWGLAAGYGMDDPDDEDLSTYANGRALNTWIYYNVTYSPVKDIFFRVGADYLSTEYINDAEAQTNLRLMFVTQYNF